MRRPHELQDMDASSYERICLCALNTIFGYNPMAGLALIEGLGSGAAAFALEPAELRGLLRGYPVHASRMDGRALEAAASQLEDMAARGAAFVSVADDCYPELLRECPDRPIGLYVCGASPPEILFSKKPVIAIVGTRDISPYGRKWCRRIVEALSCTEEKPLITSGLAYGTDIAAHMHALDLGLPTIAVMATGIDSVYPASHRGAARRIVRGEGCAVITDYPPGTEPIPINFIRRNRIIAGMSSAVILIESRIKGGGMTTARLADGYSRPVYALPGRTDDERSQGCNRLIGEKTAEIFTDADDLVLRLGLHAPARAPERSAAERLRVRYLRTLSEPKIEAVSKVYAAIEASAGISPDSICRQTGLAWPEVAECISILENDGLISVDLLQRCSTTGKPF